MKAKQKSEILAWSVLFAIPLLLLAILFSQNKPSTNEVVDHIVILTFVGYAIDRITARQSPK